MKREEKKLAYREKHAEEAMLDICSKHMMLGANAVVKLGYRRGFDEGVRWADYNPFGVIDEDFAWDIYNFICKWKNGDFGAVTLQTALREFGKEMIR